jgi:long-chain acyl-CoA synthetase
MVVSYQEALAQVTAPGQLFETEQIVVDGVEMTAFKNGPASVRDLLGLARFRPDPTFLVFEDERWTFGDVMSHADALSALLVNRFGVAKGDRVAIGMRNYPEWVISFAGIQGIGAVSVSLNAWWTADELDFALSDSTPKVLIADAERAERCAPTCARLGIAIIVVRPNGPIPDGAARWSDVVHPGPTVARVHIEPDDDATILYTSGTTGTPKGAVSTQRALVQAILGFGCRKAVEELRYPEKPIDTPAGEGQTTFILIVPLFHVTGMVPVMMSSFITGAKLVMLHRWDPERALQLIERERVNLFVGVPTQVRDLVESPRFHEFDTSSLRTIGGGGAPTPPDLVDKVEHSTAAGRPNIGYGMTETNAYGPQNSGDDYVSHPTSTGRATPIVQIAVRDSDGEDLPNGSIGELWFKGPHLIRGYWNRPDETAETIHDGWLRTGDLGYVDDDDFVYVVDRAKDIVLRGGENVFCPEVEAALYRHPAVAEAAVYGLPDQRLGEAVAATVLLRAGESATAEELQAFVGQHLAPFKVPSRIDFAEDALPRNAAGKILKREIRDQLIKASGG